MSNRTLDETEALFVDLSKPDLRTLAVVLRNRMLWPAGFEWNYSSCYTCAMGMAHVLWRERIALPQSHVVGSAMGMIRSQTIRVFFNAGDAHKVDSLREVTPEMVAAEIDAILDERNA